MCKESLLCTLREKKFGGRVALRSGFLVKGGEREG